MKNWAEKKQIQIYKKMSADKKIKILDDFLRFAKALKKDANDHSAVSSQNKPNFRRAKN